MILGRNTVQWMSLITAAGGLAQLFAVMFGYDPVLVATIIGGLVTFLGVFVAFVANTSTTPTKDPVLREGTNVTVTNAAGEATGTQQLQPQG